MNRAELFSLAQPEYALFRRAYAEKKAPLVIICGSGLSTPAGLPTWPKLRAQLQKAADDRASSLNKIGHSLIMPVVEAARKQEDIWIAFKLLKEALTKPVFEQMVESNLTPVGHEKTPPSYGELLKLSPKGLVTLNLDKFAGEAFADSMQGSIITPIFGNEIAQKWDIINSAKRYLVYLHGGLHDPSTWVMTQDDLDKIFASEGHNYFVKNIFLENIVLFAGVTADDIALSKRLIDLTKGGFRPKNLYWFTNRLDYAADKWADEAHVSIIRYQAKDNNDHADAIKLLVDDCLEFVPQEVIEPPLRTDLSKEISASTTPIHDPDILAQSEPEDIRRTVSVMLNIELERSKGTEESLLNYRNFCERYDYAVHRSFYRSKAEKFREWFGYKLNFPSLGRGNFGEVYSAEDRSGQIVAVKIMHDSIFGNDDMLGGFRRGVRSMEIVTKNSISGMVPIIESFELPPTIVMPYVGGVSLEEALRSRSDLPWLTRLAIGVAIGKIVSAGHALPQTILHRDLKPSNIMISNFEYQGSFEPDVIVLDFDMSWHKGSREKDVIFESRDDFGYLAPEQTDAANRYTARSTRVDSYGYGMTLFYLFGREAPRPNEALSEHWRSRTIRASRVNYYEEWRSAPQRLGRIIAKATEIDQNERMDFSTILHNLSDLKLAASSPNKLGNPELWAEECLCNASDGLNYEWDDARGQGKIDFPSGLSVNSIGNFRNGSVIFEIKYTDVGIRERGGIGRYLSVSLDGAERAFRGLGWTVHEKRTSGGEASLKAEVNLELLRSNPKLAITAARDAVQCFRN